MSEAGFMRLQTYALSARLPKKWKDGHKVQGIRSARSILAEAARAFSSTPHIENPLPPVLCYGVNPLDLISDLETLMRNGRSPSGRKLRKDSQLLGAGTPSFPHTIEEVAKDARLQEDLYRWIQLVIRFLKKNWQDELRSVVLHTDETYPHLHFFTIAPVKNGAVMIDELHPGKRASYAVRVNASEPPLRKTLHDAYVRGLRDFQGDYYVDVSAPLGHARYGDKQPRIPYSQRQAIRANEKGISAAWRKLDEEKATYAKRQDEEQQTLLEERRAVDAAMFEVEQMLAAVYEEREELLRWRNWAKEQGIQLPAELDALIDPTA